MLKSIILSLCIATPVFAAELGIQDQLQNLHSNLPHSLRDIQKMTPEERAVHIQTFDDGIKEEIYTDYENFVKDHGLGDAFIIKTKRALESLESGKNFILGQITQINKAMEAAQKQQEECLLQNKIFTDEIQGLADLFIQHAAQHAPNAINLKDLFASTFRNYCEHHYTLGKKFKSTPMKLTENEQKMKETQDLFNTLILDLSKIFNVDKTYILLNPALQKCHAYELRYFTIQSFYESSQMQIKQNQDKRKVAEQKVSEFNSQIQALKTPVYTFLSDLESIINTF